MLRKKMLSVGYALRGIQIAYFEESNFQIQLALCAFAILLGLYFKISIIEWLMIFIVSGLVFTAEIFNTALEELCDMLKQTHDPHVAKIKDLSAGAVLAASSAALVTGLIIFIPKIFFS